LFQIKTKLDVVIVLTDSGEIWSYEIDDILQSLAAKAEQRAQRYETYSAVPPGNANKIHVNLVNAAVRTHLWHFISEFEGTQMFTQEMYPCLNTWVLVHTLRVVP